VGRRRPTCPSGVVRWDRRVRSDSRAAWCGGGRSCDFSIIKEYLDEVAAKKKEIGAEEKKKAKAEKDVLEEPFLHAIVDGRKEKLGNFRVEPPGLFRGRGKHPKMGQLKKRMIPEDITLNMSKGAKARSHHPPHTARAHRTRTHRAHTARAQRKRTPHTARHTRRGASPSARLPKHTRSGAARDHVTR
jgi:hypothetical protein